MKVCLQNPSPVLTFTPLLSPLPAFWVGKGEVKILCHQQRIEVERKRKKKEEKVSKGKETLTVGKIIKTFT